MHMNHAMSIINLPAWLPFMCNLIIISSDISYVNPVIFCSPNAVLGTISIIVGASVLKPKTHQFENVTGCPPAQFVRSTSKVFVPCNSLWICNCTKNLLRDRVGPDRRLSTCKVAMDEETSSGAQLINDVHMPLKHIHEKWIELPGPIKEANAKRRKKTT